MLPADTLVRAPAEVPENGAYGVADGGLDKAFAESDLARGHFFLGVLDPSFVGHSRVYGARRGWQADYLQGKTIMVLGMGAQGVENARTALLAKAKHVILVARRPSLTVSGFGAYMQTIQEDRLMRIGDQLQERQEGRAPKLNPMHLACAPDGPFVYCGDTNRMRKYPYVATGMESRYQSSVAAAGAVLTVADTFFIGKLLNKLQVEIANDWEFTEDGLELSTGQRLRADLIIKNFGYDGFAVAHQLQAMTGKMQMVAPGWISPNICYVVPNRNPEIFRVQAVFAGGVTEGPALDMPTIVGGVTNLADLLIETFLYFARRRAELLAFMGQGGSPDAAGPGGDNRKPAPLVEIERDGPLVYSQGIWAAMQWAPDMAARVRYRRADVNRRMSERYSLREFLEKNQKEWEDYCFRMTGDPNATPFPWADVLAELKTTPNLLGHLLTNAHAPESRL